jgi:hypothetical protein
MSAMIAQVQKLEHYNLWNYISDFVHYVTMLIICMHYVTILVIFVSHQNTTNESVPTDKT